MPEMPTWKLRAPRALTDAYVSACRRLGTTASADVVDHMVRYVRRHGTAEEKAKLAAALEELNRTRPGPKRH